MFQEQLNDPPTNLNDNVVKTRASYEAGEALSSLTSRRAGVQGWLVGGMLTAICELACSPSHVKHPGGGGG